jgi:hypothetical protein
MPLPTSGPLSFSTIAAALSTAPPFSLRNMSAIVGFTTPDAVSSFYGYGPSCTPYGTFLYSSCNVCELIYHYADGNCGEYTEVISYNSPDCGCLTLFYRTFDYGFGVNEQCFNGCVTEAYHNGQNPLPGVGDIVYQDPQGNFILKPDGVYWGMSEIQYEAAGITFSVVRRTGAVDTLGLCLIM